MIDIIIPVLNESEFLEQHAEYYLALAEKARIIFVDGGSRDNTVSVAKRYGVVCSSQKGRALQKNKGVEISESEYLLFLHVDSLIDIAILEKIENILKQGFAAGCMQMHIDHPFFIFRIFEKIVNARARYFKVLDGDLGLFIQKEAFYKIGCFDPVPVMEDILIGYKLKKNTSKIVVLRDKIHVSARKWKEQNSVKVFFQYGNAYLWLWKKIVLDKFMQDDFRRTIEPHRDA